jgi:hypothetical protein
MSLVAALVLSQMREMERTFHAGDCPPLPRSKTFTGARKIQRAAKKRRNRIRNRS